MGTKALPVLARLKKLMLSISHDEHNDSGAPWRSRVNRAAAPHLQRSLLHVPKLETLRLNFHSGQFLAYRFLEWLGESEQMPVPAVSLHDDMIQPVSLVHLKDLDLGMLKVSAPTLINVITKFDLVTLNLWRVSILCQRKHDLQAQPDHWARFFSDLADALPASTHLESVLVGQAHQGFHSRTYDKVVRVYFNPLQGQSESAKPYTTS
jgi:hypothetical protein